MLYQISSKIKYDPLIGDEQNPEIVKKEIAHTHRTISIISSAIIALIVAFALALNEDDAAQFIFLFIFLGGASFFVTFILSSVIVPCIPIKRNTVFWQNNDIVLKNTYYLNTQYTIPISPIITSLFSANKEIQSESSYLWIDIDKIYACTEKYFYDYGKITIPLDNISFFVREGDFYTETKTQIERKGRLLGALIAGDYGLINGTHNEVTNTTVAVDKRKTFLYMEKDGEEAAFILGSNAYDYLMEEIPQKEYKNVTLTRPFPAQENTPEVTEKDDVFETIKKLAELQKQGILTDEEYQEKKKHLLENI